MSPDLVRENSGDREWIIHSPSCHRGQPIMHPVRHVTTGNLSQSDIADSRSVKELADPNISDSWAPLPLLCHFYSPTNTGKRNGPQSKTRRIK